MVKEEIVSFKSRYLLNEAGEIGVAGILAIHGRELSRTFARALRDPLRIIWLQGGGDSGCTLSLLQGAPPGLMDAVVAFRKAVDFYPMHMVPSSDRALFTLSHALAGQAPLDLLIVEGGTPPGGPDHSAGDPARLVPFETWVRDLAAAAARVVAIGTCASCAVSGLAPTPSVLRIPGCPAPPDRVLLTLARMLSEVMPAGPEMRDRGISPREVFRPVFQGGGPRDN